MALPHVTLDFLFDVLIVELEETAVEPLLLVEFVLVYQLPYFVERLEIVLQLLEIGILRQGLIQQVLPVIERVHLFHRLVELIFQNTRLAQVLYHYNTKPFILLYILNLLTSSKSFYR